MSRLAGKVALITGRLRASGRRSPPPARPALGCYSQEENQYKGDPNEHFKQPARVGCNRTSRKTCRKEFKRKIRTPFGRDAKESESGGARRPVWGITLHRSR